MGQVHPLDQEQHGAGGHPADDVAQALASRPPVGEWLGRDERQFAAASRDEMGEAAADLQAQWDADPGDEDTALALVAAHISQSQGHLADDQPDLAARSAASAVATAQDVIGRRAPDERLDDRDGIQLLAVALIRLGESLCALGRPADGGQVLLRVVDLDEEVQARHPDQPLDPSLTTFAFALLAETLKQMERFDEVVEVERARVANCVRLDRGESAQRLRSAVAHARLAQALAAADRMDEAFAEQARAVEAYDSVDESDMSDEFDVQQAAWADLNLALFQLEYERLEEAQRSSRRALESFVGLFERAPTLSSRQMLTGPLTASFDALSDALFESGRTDEADAIDDVSGKFRADMERTVDAARADGTFE